METPKNWGEYLDYIEAHNKLVVQKWESQKAIWKTEHKNKPWYKKIFSGRMFMTAYDDIDIQCDWGAWNETITPSELGYFEWDVKRSKKVTT